MMQRHVLRVGAFAACLILCSWKPQPWASESTDQWERALEAAAAAETRVPPFLAPALEVLLDDEGALDPRAVEALMPFLLDAPEQLQTVLALAARKAPREALGSIKKAFLESRASKDRVGAAIVLRDSRLRDPARHLRQLAAASADVEASDWARLLADHAAGLEPSPEVRPLHRAESLFDQVIPLSLHVTVYLPQSDGRVYALPLAPRDVRRTYGDLYACLNRDAEQQRLVIARHLRLDGALEVQGLLFEGVSIASGASAQVGHFVHQSERAAVLSSRGHASSLGNAVPRSALRLVVKLARASSTPQRTGANVAENSSPIRFLSGELRGWVAIDLSQLDDDDDGDGNPLDPGEFALTPRGYGAPPLANAYVVARVYGKNVDVDADGRVDLIHLEPKVDEYARSTRARLTASGDHERK